MAPEACAYDFLSCNFRCSKPAVSLDFSGVGQVLLRMAQLPGHWAVGRLAGPGGCVRNATSKAVQLPCCDAQHLLDLVLSIIKIAFVALHNFTLQSKFPYTKMIYAVSEGCSASHRDLTFGELNVSDS